MLSSFQSAPPPSSADLDLELLAELQRLTPAERVQRHEEARLLVGGMAAGAVSLELGVFSCRVMGLDDLIRAKRTLARPKDLRTALELETIRQQLKPSQR